MENEIYKFRNGTIINLKYIVAIGQIAKNSSNQYFVPVYCLNSSKAIEIILGYSVGQLAEEHRTAILYNIDNFITTWENYLITSKH